MIKISIKKNLPKWELQEWLNERESKVIKNPDEKVLHQSIKSHREAWEGQWPPL